MNYKCYICPHCKENYGEDEEGHLLNLKCKVTGKSIVIRECPEYELWEGEDSWEGEKALIDMKVKPYSGLHLSAAPPGNIPHPKSDKLWEEGSTNKRRC